MLAYLLALVVGIGSLTIYLAAFFFPEIHRKNDFIWSGVGLFYALVLWIFASRITGGLLLGHLASVALLVWFGWQTLSLRRQLTPEVQQTPVPSPELVKVSVQEQVSKLSLQQKLGQLPSLMANVFSGVKGKVQQIGQKQPAVPPEKPAVTIIDHTTPIPEQPNEIATPPTEAVTVTSVEAETATVEVIPEAIPPTAGTSELVAPEETQSISVEEVFAETETIVDSETVAEAIPPISPTPELVAQAQEETEEKQTITQEVIPEAILPTAGTSELVAPEETQSISVEEVVAEMETVVGSETVPEAIPPLPPTPELVAQAQEETEEKPSISVEEVAPDAALAPPAEAPAEKLPPSDGSGG